MDEDIRFPVSILSANGSPTVRYFVCPYKCTVRDLIGAVSLDVGDDETVTLINYTDTKTLGVLAFGSDIAAGAKGTWTPDVTNGNYVNDVGDVLEFTITDCTVAGVFEMLLELDPKCRIP